jgi:hypothetical protein
VRKTHNIFGDVLQELSLVALGPDDNRRVGGRRLEFWTYCVNLRKTLNLSELLFSQLSKGIFVTDTISTSD